MAPIHLLAFSAHADNTLHDGFLRRYAETGEARMLGAPKRRLEAKHRTGHLFFVDIAVSKVVSGGEVSFMGVLQAAQDDGSATAILAADGTIIYANPSFHALFGFTTNGAGTNIRAVIVGAGGGHSGGDGAEQPGEGEERADALEDILAKAQAGPAEVERLLEGRTVQGALFPISCNFHQSGGAAAGGGGGGGRGGLQQHHHSSAAGGSISLKVMSLNDSVGMLTIAEDGAIVHANAVASRLFGWKPEELTIMNISQVRRPALQQPSPPACLRCTLFSTLAACMA